MIVVTVFLLIMNQTEIRLVHNDKENCSISRSDGFPFDYEPIRIPFGS